MARTLSVPTTTHGRVLVEDAAVPVPSGLLVLLHGYGQNASEMLDEAQAIPGADRWTRVAVQGLHRFYARDHQRVVASWMTREDRDDAIADNLAYVDRVLDAVLGDGAAWRQSTSVRDGDGAAWRQSTSVPIVFAGFSQGVAMAYRAAIGGRHPAAGVVALAGDVPPELATASSARDRWPAVLIGVGTKETWYSAEKLAADVRFFEARGIAHEVCRFDGGHEWAPAFHAAAGEWLARVAARRRVT